MSHRSSTLLLSLPPFHAFDIFFPPKDCYFYICIFSQGACKQGNSNCMILCYGYNHSQDQISLRKKVFVPSFPHSLSFFPISTKTLKTKICSSFLLFHVTVTACISVAEEWSRQAGVFFCSVLLGPLKTSPQRNMYSNCANWVSHACYLSLILTKR